MTDKILIIIFWAAAGLVALSYVFYPVLLLFLRWGRKIKKPIYFNDIPLVSIILPVYNEEKHIESRVKNLLSQTIAANFEIIIVSDASTDRTDEILRNLKNNTIKIDRLTKRSGKAACINRCVELSSNSILVFTDANTEFAPDAVEKLIRNFGGFDVGGVCGYLEITPAGKQKSESTYWKFERFLKKLEGEISSVCGANGGIYAIRKEYFKKLPEHKNILDDFITSLQPLRFGKRLIFEKDAEAIEPASESLTGEYRRKIRIGNADFNSIKEVAFLLNVFKQGWVTFFFIFHKLLRWFTPVFLLLLYFSNLFISSFYLFYNITNILQITFYLIGITGWFFMKKDKYPIVVSSVTYFCIMNISILIGMLNWLTRDSKPFWEPIRNNRKNADPL